MVTTVIGALMGAILGALVGRFIALFGDATVEVSVPMVFCGTLGYFVGGASAAKGSLDRFGAKRSSIGATAAALVLVLIVGGASVGGRASGVLIAVLGTFAAAFAGAVASFVGRPQAEPVGANGAHARPRPAPEKQPAATAEPETTVAPPPTKAPIRKVPVDVPDRDRAPEPEAFDSEEPANWTLEDELPPPPIKPPPDARPRRDRPLRKGDA
jgi:hypothetical protein